MHHDDLGDRCRCGRLLCRLTVFVLLTKAAASETRHWSILRFTPLTGWYPYGDPRLRRFGQTDKFGDSAACHA